MKKFKLALRWLFMIVSLGCLGAIIWCLFAQQVPSLISVQLIKYGGYFLSLEISRWWNILLITSVVSLMIISFHLAERLHDFDVGVVIGSLIGSGIGIIISIITGLFVIAGANLATGLIVGLVWALIISIIAGLVVSLGAGSIAGLGFGLGIGLGVDFFVGLFISFGAGLVCGIVIIVSADLAVMVRLIIKYNLLAKIRHWLSVSN